MSMQNVSCVPKAADLLVDGFGSSLNGVGQQGIRARDQTGNGQKVQRRQLDIHREKLIEEFLWVKNKSKRVL